MSVQPLQPSYVEPSLILDKDWDRARIILTDYMFKLAQAVNAREVAQYEEASLNGTGTNIAQTLSGQKWFNQADANKALPGYRTIVAITGGLANHGILTTLTQAHGIQTSDKTVFTKICGCATDPGATDTTQAIPLPYVNADALNGSIELWVDATNVNIRYIGNYSAFTSCYIILEYIYTD